MPGARPRELSKPHVYPVLRKSQRTAQRKIILYLSLSPLLPLVLALHTAPRKSRATSNGGVGSIPALWFLIVVTGIRRTSAPFWGEPLEIF